jgi:hypothetical protein
MYKIDRKLLISVPFAIVILLTGCESIPPGTAPDGSIVNFSPVSNKKPVNTKTAINTMITSLITSPAISSAEKIPTVFFKPNPLIFNDNASIENYSLDFNNYALSVYKNLLYSNLIFSPPSFNEYDYELISTYRESPSMRRKEDKKIFLWNLALYSSKNKNHPVWDYSLNVFVPIKEIKSNNEENSNL